MKATIALDKLIIKSELTVDKYQKAMEFYPELLSIKDDNGDVLFKVLFKNGVSSIGKYGICFGDVDDEEYPTAVIQLQSETRDEKLDEAAKLIMVAEKSIKVIEATIRAAIPEAEEKLAKIKEKITVIA